jgi:N-acetylglucosamine-6-phosphate deacetylase
VTTIQGGRLATGEEVVVHIDGGVFVDEPPAGSEKIDAEGLIVSPGLIDIQINGGFGFDFTQDPTTIWKVGERLPEMGVTSFVPTVVTSPGSVTDLALEVVSKQRPDGYRGAHLIGLHFEGPWISPVMHGAHNPDHITDPDLETASRWAESGLVRIVTLAPERSGAGPVIAELNRAGVVVSVGHTAADYETARQALSSGATLVTHLFNQMTPLTHREPGVVGAGLLNAAHCLLIVDGHHLSDGALEVAWRVLGPERVILVTDAMAAMGLGPGTYPLGDGPITVGDNGPRTTDGRLAGSVITLPEAVANLVASTSATLPEAMVSVTFNPAAALGLTDRGEIAPGRRADLTLFDRDLKVVTTFVAGDRIYG